MHREVNYHVEAATTRRFAERLKDDERYIVPTIVDEYCTDQVLCMTLNVACQLIVQSCFPSSRTSQSTR